MGDVIIAGMGSLPVGEYWDVSLRQLGARAIRAALQDAEARGWGRVTPQALYIGNLLASTLSHQANLGALIAANSGYEGMEAFTIEAAEASGAAAFHMATMAVSSGLLDSALVLGVEKFTDTVGARAEGAVAEITDSDYEAMHGLTPTAQAGLLLRRYQYEFDVPPDAMAVFSMLAHANAVANPHAMFRKAIRKEAYMNAPMVSDPLNLFDAAPYADGAGAILLARAELLPQQNASFVRVSGSSVVTDRLALHDRPDPLAFEAVGLSIERACRQAGCMPADMDLFEVWDGFSIDAALSLEAANFAPRGQSWRMAQEGYFDRTGKLPILTMGGQKARGNPLGAAGVYQLIEAVQQLEGKAGANQIAGAQRALVQALGGPASTAVAHVLEHRAV